jgi:hypothetical protein
VKSTTSVVVGVVIEVTSEQSLQVRFVEDCNPA